MAAGPVFPGFIRVEYQTDGSAKSKFLAEAAQLSGEVKKPFAEAFDNIGKMVDRVSGKFRDGNFKLEVDVTTLREASAKAEFTAAKLAALRDAALSIAGANKDQSASTLAFTKGLQAQAAEAERASQAARDQLTAYTNLQAALDTTARKNDALAKSYRDLAIAQGRQLADSQTTRLPTQKLVFGADALVSGQGSLDRAAVSGVKLEQVLGRVANKGKEVTAALREAAAAADKAANVEVGPKRANPGPTNARSGADALVAGKASLDRAAISATTLEQVLGRVANKGREVGNALAEAERAAAKATQERVAAQAKAEAEATAAKERASAELLRLGQAAEELNARLNPAVGIQQRYNNEIENARNLLKAGVIDQNLYAQAVQSAAEDQASALKVLEAAQEQANQSDKRGTSERQNVINSIRSQRVAFVQLGQQMQDVVVQAQMGTSAFTIFSQQVPQAAFALSGLEGNANETLDKVGEFATFLSGPWGAALFAATAVLGPYIAELFRATDALDEVGKAAQDAMQKLQQSVANASNFTDAISKSQTSLVTAMGKVGRAQRDILETQKAINALQGRAGSSQTVTALSNRLTQLQLEKTAAQKELDTAKADLANIRGLADTVRIQEANRKALNPDKPKKERKDRSAERAARAAMVLGEFGEDQAKKIEKIRNSFADIPPEVERVANASLELDDIISDLQTRQPLNFEKSIAEAEALKKALPDMAVQQAMEQITQEAQQQVQYQMLMLQGREGEAQALQIIAQKEEQYGKLTRERKEQIIATGIAMQRINEEMQRASEIQGVFLDATRNVRSEVEGILGGYRSLGDLGATLRRSFQQIQGKLLTEQIFGDLFRDMDRYVKEKTGIGSSVDMLAKETERAGGSAKNFADAIDTATRRILSGGSGAGGVVAGASAVTAWGNMKIPDSIRLPGYDLDPNGPSTVKGAAQKSNKPTLASMTPEEYFRRMGQEVGAKWAAQLEPLLGKKFAGNIGGVIGGILEGQATTGTGFGAILGGLKELKGLPKGISGALGKAFGGAQTGAAVAGIGNALGLKLSNTGAQIGGAIGKFLPIPGGEIIGAIAGGFIGKLFSGTKKGYAVATNGNVSTGGNSTQAANAGQGANAINDSLSSIARAFGTSLGNYAVSIGSRSSGYIRVSASGSTKVGDKHYNSGPDVLYDGKDMEEALRIALKNAIEDGAIQGIRAGTKRILSASKNIDAQVEKALKFEKVFKDLRAIKDPVGAALEELNTEFKGLIDIFKEAGASAQEMAELEELYGIRRKEAIKQATESALGPIKSLLDSLNIGSEFYSLRDRQASAQAVYNPLAERVKAGDMTAYAEFADAAQSLIEINRQIYGSTSQFFDFVDQVKALSQGTLDREQAKIDAATASDSPFTQLAAQQQATTSAIDAQTEALIAAIGGRLDTMNSNLIAALRAAAANNNTVQYTGLFAPRGAW